MKKFNLRKVKWENIFLLIFIPLGIQAMIHHYLLNGFYKYILIEPLIYIGLPIILSYCIKDIRKGEY